MEFEQIKHLITLLNRYCKSKEDYCFEVKINEKNINNIVFMIKRLANNLQDNERGMTIGRLKEVLYYIDMHIEKLINSENYKSDYCYQYVLEDMCALYRTKDKIEEIVSFIIEKVKMDNITVSYVDKVMGRIYI